MDLSVEPGRTSQKSRESIFWWSIVFAIVFIVIQVCAGLLFGFGKSPYNHSAVGIFLNILSFGTMVVGRENARSYITGVLTKKEKVTAFIIIALFMTGIEYPVSKFSRLNDIQTIVKFFAQYFLPDLCQNLFATYLAFVGGSIPAIAYMGILEAFHWLYPILPNLKWIISALIGIMAPVFFLFALQNIYLRETRKIKMYENNSESPVGWMITSILSIGIIWFSIGVFPIYPSVIVTGSMEPLIKPGDVILVDKIQKSEDIDQLKTGDIIQFKMDDILVSHRIINIVEDEYGKRYMTKGDNNNSPDTDLVLPQDIKGRIVQIIPKIGWPTLLIRQRDELPYDRIEIGN